MIEAAREDMLGCVDSRGATSYVQTMATVLSQREQAETGALARRLGGYGEMLRLEAELRALQAKGHRPKLVMDPATGRRSIEKA